MASKATAVAIAAAPAPQVAPHQAGGGVSGEVRSVKTLNATVLSYLKTLYNAHVAPPAKGKATSKDQSPAGWSSDDAAVFLKNVQRQEDGGGVVGLVKKDWAFDDFVKYMTSSVTNVVAPPHPDDASWPLSSYFISSSHNTYLTGNQLYSNSSTDAYKNVLLRGCRCIEIDVWDGDDSDSDTSSSSSDEDDPRKFEKRKTQVKKVKEKMPSSIIGRFEKTSLSNKLDEYVDKKKPDTATIPDGEAEAPLEKKASTGFSRSPTRVSGAFKEPRVLHGYTLTKEVLFRDVCTSIRDYGFVVSDLPVIVSLEVHCSAEQQEAMVHIMEQVWEGYLLPQQEVEAQSLPAPGDLRRKILVKVKYAPPEGVSPPVEEGAKPVAKTTSLTASPPSPTGAKKTPAKASKIIQALSKLGIYTRGVSFKSLTQPEASIPTHVFSLSESGVKEVHEKCAVELFNHNRKFLMRAYPSGLRIGSSNLDPAVFWRKGIQIVALNWQNWDEGMMLNEGMFAGTGGYVLKPGGYRPDNKTPIATSGTPAPQATAVRHYSMDLTIEVLAAQSLPLPPGDTNPKSFNPYVKVEVHVEEPGERHGVGLPADGKEKEGEYKAKTKSHKGCDPDFKRQELKFKKIPGVVPELSFVRFLVRDDNIGRDALAAWACVRLDRLREGYRFVHLLDAEGMETEAVVLVRVSKTLA